MENIKKQSLAQQHTKFSYQSKLPSRQMETLVFRFIESPGSPAFGWDLSVAKNLVEESSTGPFRVKVNWIVLMAMEWSLDRKTMEIMAKLERWDVVSESQGGADSSGKYHRAWA